MAKNRGILLDPATGDLQASTRRDALGLVALGLEIGETAAQNQALILRASKGEFKTSPMLGTGIADMVGDNETAGWKREITLQLESDGMRVKSVELEIQNNRLTIDADYDS